jgi:hypothetical protein
MNARHSIAAWLGFCSLMMVLWAQPAQAQLSGPLCYQTGSTAAKVGTYRMYYHVSPDGHFVIGGRASVRTNVGLGTTLLTYAISGGAFTASGGDIWAGITVYWINNPNANAAPFHAMLFINHVNINNSVVEILDGVETTYTLNAVNCDAFLG